MRHMKLVAGVALISVVAWGSMMAGGANSDESQATSDLRCLIVALNFSSSPNAAQKQAGFIQTLYYLGRYDARVPNVNLETVVANEIGRMKTLDVRAESKRCGDFLQRRGVALQTLGKALISGTPQK